MRDRPSTKRLSEESTITPLEEDLAEVVRRRPEVVGNRPAFLDMVQVDYWRCCRSGASLSASTYCSRLPITDEGLLLSIRRLVEVERYLLENPNLLSLAGEPDWPNELETFDGFLLEKEIGRGAASRVYRARQPELGDRRVVLKITPYAKAEANVMGRSDHPGVVPVFSTGIEPLSGLHWICMPYLGERTLQSVIALKRSSPSKQGLRKVRRFPLDQTTVIAHGLAEALAYLHQRGIQHGDLKPSNILLRDDGRPMLIDFNLSQIDSAENALVGGTLPYMPPEALRYFASDKDLTKPSLSRDRAIAADVYAFGCTLFQLLTGRTFVEISEEVADAQLIAVQLLDSQTEGTRRLSNDLASAPPELARIAAECLSLNPQDRPRSFKLVVEQLTQRTATSSLQVYRPALVVGAAVGLLAVTWLFAFSPLGPAARLREAQRMIKQDQLGKAQSILTNLSSDPERGEESRRLLGDALLDDDKFNQAAEVLERLAAETKAGKTYALAGYVRHLLRDDAIAVVHDRYAIAQGCCTASLQNNYAAGLLRDLPRHYETTLSAEICKLLREAHRLDPTNETVRINALRHIEILDTLGQGHGYSVVDLLKPALDDPSTDYLRLACRYLASEDVGDEVIVRVGLPILCDLSEVFDDFSLSTLLGKSRWNRYRQLPGFVTNGGLSRDRRIDRSTPPVFLDPRGDG